MNRIYASLLMLFFCVALFGLEATAGQDGAPTTETTLTTDEALGDLFDQAGVNGTFVLFDVAANQMVVHDKIRASKRFIPASTFKVPNSLIGLTTGAVGDVEELIPYGGKPQFLKIWERDMGLRDAIKVSNVPVYQELARRIGLEQMSKYVGLLDYGNANIGETVDRFWLDGPLKVSAIEQTRFLARLAQGELPLPETVQQSVREITLYDSGEGWVLHAKTGWSIASSPDIGWWVGWVVNDGRVYSFALNIDMPEEGDSRKRVKLGKASLRSLGIID